MMHGQKNIKNEHIVFGRFVCVDWTDND